MAPNNKRPAKIEIVTNNSSIGGDLIQLAGPMAIVISLSISNFVSIFAITALCATTIIVAYIVTSQSRTREIATRCSMSTVAGNAFAWALTPTANEQVAVVTPPEQQNTQNPKPKNNEPRGADRAGLAFGPEATAQAGTAPQTIREPAKPVKPTQAPLKKPRQKSEPAAVDSIVKKQQDDAPKREFKPRVPLSKYAPRA